MRQPRLQLRGGERSLGPRDIPGKMPFQNAAPGKYQTVFAVGLKLQNESGRILQPAQCQQTGQQLVTHPLIVIFIECEHLCVLLHRPLERDGDSVRRPGLRENVREHPAVHVAMPEIAAPETVGELFVVEAELVQDGSPQVVHRRDAIHRIVAQLVRGAVGESAFEAASGQHDRKAHGIVIASVRALGEGGAPELAGEHKEGALEQSALFEVADEGGDGL